MTSTLSKTARRAAAVSAGAVALVGLSALLATPAMADVPVGWSDPAPVDGLHALLLVLILPVAGALVIAALVLGPGLLRGERLQPGAPAVENQWLGGPSKGTAELEGPDTDESQAGGASARW